MRNVFGERRCALALLAGLLTTGYASADLRLGPETIVRAGGSDITVYGYSVPSYADWNSDGLYDLIIGEGGSGYNGKVRVYLNGGTRQDPLFTAFTYAQSNGSDLSLPPGNCLGAFPRAVYWDADQRKDLIVGRGDGKVQLYLNTGTEQNPSFDAGALLQVGQPGSKIDINVGGRATPIALDWNNDGRKDLVIGGVDGRLRVYLNEGTHDAPDFRAMQYARENSGVLSVPSGRSSPVVMDLNDDHRKDILTGNTEGELLLYRNTGTDEDPSFSGHEAVTSDGVPIHLPGSPRTRPFVCDWTHDGLLDVLLGAGGGRIHLYQGVPEPRTLPLLVVAALMRRRRPRAV